MQRRQFLIQGASSAALGCSLAGAGVWAGLGFPGAAPQRVIQGGFNGIDVRRGHYLRNRVGLAYEQGVQGAPVRTRRTDVIIAGGGVAGLAAARALRAQGVEDFLVLDLEDKPGGNSRASRVQGQDCPMGAHYLPAPSDSARLVQDFLEEIGIRKRVSGRWTYDERHLCSAPQERLFFRGRWQEGLLPVEGVGEATLEEYRRFSRRIAALMAQNRFAIPVSASALEPLMLELDGLTFAAWLDREGFEDAFLRWYLEYCCRDDYGAGAQYVSAWAGVHYFASRHGFVAPGEEGEPEQLLTWPQGNAFLVEKLSRPLGERSVGAQLTTRIMESKDSITVDALDFSTGEPLPVRYTAKRAIVALPLMIAARVVQNPPQMLLDAARGHASAPWLVANIHVKEPLATAPHQAAPSWDNVFFDGPSLGYVDARHQSLNPAPAPTVLTWYRPLGPSRYPGDGAGALKTLYEEPWIDWRDTILKDMSVAHPQISELATRIEITRYGHAMAIPLPGRLHALGARAKVTAGRLAFAHSDWSGYSIFEEAFTRGHLAV